MDFVLAPHQMLGSYGPSSDGKPYERPNFHTEESPSGLLARQGSYNVRSKFIDDDGEVYAGASLDLCDISLPSTSTFLLCFGWNIDRYRLPVAIQTCQGVVGVLLTLVVYLYRFATRFYLCFPFPTCRPLYAPIHP